MIGRLSYIAALCLSAGTASAQDRVSPEVFLDTAVGRTLTFNAFPEGWHVGTEEFLRRDLSVWREAGGACVYGRITVENNEICFDYDDMPDMPVCWAVFIEDDRFLVLHSEIGNYEIQEVTSISEDGLDCPIKPGV